MYLTTDQLEGVLDMLKRYFIGRLGLTDAVLDKWAGLLSFELRLTRCNMQQSCWHRRLTQIQGPGSMLEQ